MTAAPQTCIGTLRQSQVAHFAHLIVLLQWLPGRLNFTGLEHYGGWSARTCSGWATGTVMLNSVRASVLARP